MVFICEGVRSSFDSHCKKIFSYRKLLHSWWECRLVQSLWRSVCAVVKSLQSCLTLCDLRDCSPPGSSVHGWDSPGQNTGMGCQALLQGIFPAQKLNPRLLRLCISRRVTTSVTWEAQGTVWRFHKKLKIEIPYDHQSYSWAYI